MISSDYSSFFSSTIRHGVDEQEEQPHELGGGGEEEPPARASGPGEHTERC